MTSFTALLGGGGYPVGATFSGPVNANYSGWLEEQGQLLLQSAYPELYATIGSEPDPVALTGYTAANSPSGTGGAPSRVRLLDNKLIFPAAYGGFSGTQISAIGVWDGAAYSRVTAATSGAAICCDVAYNGSNLWCAVMSDNTGLMTSPSITSPTWTSRSGKSSSGYGAIAFGNGIFMHLYSDANTSIKYVSGNGSGAFSTGTAVSGLADYSVAISVRDVFWTGTAWLAAAVYNTTGVGFLPIVLRSTNGTSWSVIPAASYGMQTQGYATNGVGGGIHFSTVDGTLYALTSLGILFTSTDDGLTWTFVRRIGNIAYSSASNAETFYSPILKSGNIYWAYSSSVALYVSFDKIIWKKISVGGVSAAGFLNGECVTHNMSNSLFSLGRSDPYNFDETTLFKLPVSMGTYVKASA